MKKAISILAAIIIFASCEPRVVYVRKPNLTDTTVLKAQMSLKEWRENFDSIRISALKLYSPEVMKDTLLQKQCFTSIGNAISKIDKSLGDSNLNPIFKK